MSRSLLLRKNKKEIEYKALVTLLDIFHLVNLQELNSINEGSVSSYHNSKYAFKEIKREFEYVFSLLTGKKGLMAGVLMRNIYEDMMYFIATSINPEIVVRITSPADQFRKYVKDNFAICFDDLFEAEDLNQFYKHLCKIVHVTSIKECISYLETSNKYCDYIITELKCETIMLECIFLDYLHRRGKYNPDIHRETLNLEAAISIANCMYAIKENKNKPNNRISRFFRDEASRNYLQTKANVAVEEMTSLSQQIELINTIMRNCSIELVKKYNDLGYEQQINDFLSSTASK